MNRSKLFLEQCASLRNDALIMRSKTFFEQVAREWLFIAAVEFLNGAAPEKVFESLKNTLHEIQQAFDLGYFPLPEQLLEYFCIALIVKDLSFAHFLASLSMVYPETPSIPLIQARIAFSLLRRQSNLSDKFLQELYELIFESTKNEKAEKDLNWERATYHILGNIAKHDSATFHEAMRVRLTLQSEIQSKDSCDQWDLIGLGFCQLARLSLMIVHIKHPRLPAALLDVKSAQEGVRSCLLP